MSFLVVAAFSANAQSSCSKSKKSCAKACAKKKAAATSANAAETVDATAVAAMYREADAAAESDEAVEKRVCSKSGSVTYHQKSVCEKSGKESWSEVSYDGDLKKFVSSTTEVSEGEAKACCVGKAVKGDCCKGKTKASCSKNKKSCSKKIKASAEEKETKV